MQDEKLKIIEEAPKLEQQNLGAPKEYKKKKDPVTIIGIILCVILAPILLMNVILLGKSLIEPDKVPSIGGVSPMVVMSPSMTPTINEGDIIFVKEVDPSTLEAGDVITFFDPQSKTGKVNTHRIKEVIIAQDGTIEFKTQGDRLGNGVDPINVQAEKVIGIWEGQRIPFVGNVVMFMQTIPGLIVGIGVPLALLVGYDYLRRRSFSNDQASERDRLLKEIEELKKERNMK